MTPAEGFGPENCCQIPRKRFLQPGAGSLAWDRPCCGRPLAFSRLDHLTCQVIAAQWLSLDAWVRCITESFHFCGPKEMDILETCLFLYPFRPLARSLLAWPWGWNFVHLFAPCWPWAAPSSSGLSAPGSSVFLPPSFFSTGPQPCLLHDGHLLSYLPSLSLPGTFWKRKLEPCKVWAQNS